MVAAFPTRILISSSMVVVHVVVEQCSMYDKMQSIYLQEVLVANVEIFFFKKF